MRIRVEQEMTYKGVCVWRGESEDGERGCFVECLPGFVGSYLDAERAIDDMLDPPQPARRLHVA